MKPKAPATAAVSLEDQIEELKRELAKRREVYPRWVEQGKLSFPLSEHRIKCLAAAIETLEQQHAKQNPKLL